MSFLFATFFKPEQEPELIIKSKGGRPKGSTKTNAICRSPELKIIQKKKNNIAYKQSKSYTNSKLKKLISKHNLDLNLDKNLTQEELEKLLFEVKIENMINRANKLKDTTLSTLGK